MRNHNCHRCQGERPKGRGRRYCDTCRTLCSICWTAHRLPLQSKCLPCSREYHAIWRRANPEKIRVYYERKKVAGVGS